MGADLLAIIRAGGKAAGPLAVGAWGAYLIFISPQMPAEYADRVAQVGFLALLGGAIAAVVMALKTAFIDPPEPKPKGPKRA